MAEPLTMLGKILRERYQILSYLGSGGFGQTFLAKDLDLPGQPSCVVKRFCPLSNQSEVTKKSRELFQREAQVLYQLGNHHQIPQLFAHFEQAQEFYLVQEYIEGKSLAQELTFGKTLSEGEVIALLNDILTVLDFVHHQQVIHRDIKPSNLIRRTQDGKIVLIDFGAVKQVISQACHSTSEHHLHTIIGTPGYMAPEQALGKPQFNSDLYAVGVLGIQALTGLSPYQLTQESETEELAWKDRLEPSLKFSPLLLILDRLICADFRLRYHSSAEVLQALSQLSLTSFNPSDPSAAPTVIIPEITRPPASYLQALPSKQLNREEYRYRQILINKVRNFWIKGVLETSIHGRALIELGLELRQDLVEQPWGLVWGNPETGGELLSKGTTVLEKFREMGEGRSLLILGEPGAGKTTTLLQLARDLLNQAEIDLNHPIPVVFNLSSWTNEKHSLEQWLILELNAKYQASKEIAHYWLETGQLLLLLDGLDEVNIKRRSQCVTAINKFYQEHGTIELVVCSRIQDYQILKERLKFQGSIYLQPLTLEQILQHLEDAGSELEAIKKALKEDLTLQELAQSPLILSIMTLAYQGISASDLYHLDEIEQRRKHLFDTYINRMFSHRTISHEYSKEKALHWLVWLAKKLDKNSQTVFLIERMQPSWLEGFWEELAYVSSLFITFFLVGGWIGDQFFPTGKLVLSLVFACTGCCLIFGINRIQPVETLKWSWQKAFKSLILGMLIGALFVSPFKIIYFSIIVSVEQGKFIMIFPTLFSFFRGLFFGVSLGIVYGIVQGFKGSDVQQKTFPNQGIFQSALNSIIFALIGGCILGLSAFLIEWKVETWAILGCCFGFAAGGGEACIKHFILRIILCSHRSIPWNYARFLDEASRRILLQKVGGGYIFIHRLLLEYLAKNY